MPKHHELPFTVFATDMGKTEEVKRFRFPFAPTPSVLRCKATKLNQACFLIMKLKVELT